jgi:hypothetical protein
MKTALFLALLTGSAYAQQNYACGVDDADDIYCANDASNPVWVKQQGKLKQLSTLGRAILGSAKDNSLLLSPYISQTNFRLIHGSLVQVSMDHNVACGVNTANQIWCIEKFGKHNWFAITGALKQVEVRNGLLYGVNNHNEIWFSTSHKVLVKMHTYDVC